MAKTDAPKSKSTWIWGDTTNPAERRLVRKLDFFILTYICFNQFFNFLDRSAFANAYVAGLREALHLHGKQYNVLLSMTSAGMLVGQIPSAIMIQKIAPRIWLSSCVIVWAGLTMAGAGCKTFSQLCAVRFFMGMAEASTWAGCVYVMGSWYKTNELAKRIALLTVAGQVGNMFAGVMMAAMYKSMNGLGGMEGWQWVFIVDGIITLPVAVFGLGWFPDLPEITKAKYLNQEERQLALARLPPKRSDAHDVSWSLIKRVLAHRTFYTCFVFSFLCAILQQYSIQGLMLLYLKFYQKQQGYTQAEINTYPLGIHSIAIVSELFIAFLIDRFNARLISGLLLTGLLTVSTIVLLVPNLSIGGTLAALYLSATSYGVNPLLYGWANHIAAKSGDDAARSVILASMVAAGMILNTFWGIATFPASDAPYWQKGYIATLCVTVACAGWLFVVRWVDHKTPVNDEITEKSSHAEVEAIQVDVEKV